jgi:hypothetical protein
LSTESEGYTLLNRRRNTDGKKLWRKVHPKRKATQGSVVEGARL